MKHHSFLQSDPTKVIKTTRWEIIQTALLQDIQNSRELEQRILTYNTKYAKEWKFKSLHALFEQVSNSLDKSEKTINHLNNIIFFFNI